MSKRLNPQRRRALKAQLARTELAKALNPTTQADIGNVRMAVTKALWGGSTSLDRGLLHLEGVNSGRPIYQQHKRRSPTKAGVHVNLMDVEKVTTPDQVRDPPHRDSKPTPVATKRLGRPDKVVPKVRKSYSVDGFREDTIEERLTVKSDV